MQLKQLGYYVTTRPVKLSIVEKQWLGNQTPDELRIWSTILCRAVDRMLSQGLMNTLNGEQLHRAASLQIADLGEISNPARMLGSHLLVDTLQRDSNLRTDLARSQERIEELITEQGIPIIEVQRGDLITHKGKYISRHAYDFLTTLA